jgi:hypothetical protein
LRPFCVASGVVLERRTVWKKNILKYFVENVAGNKKGFYICTRLNAEGQF